MEGLNSSIIKSLLIALPLLQEQKAIADFLDDKTRQIDTLIEKKQKQIELLKEQRIAIINQAVTKGLDPNVKIKDSGIEWIGEIPEEWEVSRLKFIGESIIGITYSPHDIVENENEGILVLRASNIQERKLCKNDCVFVNKNISENKITKKGDILICSRSGSRALIGKNICIDESAIGITFGVFMTIFRTINYRFISNFFNSQVFKGQSSLFLTSTINQLTINTLNNFYIALPPEKEQQEIVLYIENKCKQIDKTVNKALKQIELLKEYRNALISEVVTGKIDVRDYKKDKP